MLTSKLFVTLAALACVSLLLVTKTQGACVCGQVGTDHCARCSEHTIIRPKPKPYEPIPPIELPPIGDNCWCNKMSIEPAALPKPCEKHNTPYCKCKKAKAYGIAYGGSSYTGYTGPSSYIATPVYNNPPLNYYAPQAKLKDDSPPADPVSVSLAIQAGKAIAVPEAKLAFGFIQKPLDGLQKVEFSNVPEENLFKLKSEVITLKKIPAPVKKYEEDIIIEDEEEEETLADDSEKPHLTYKQLGYDIEEFKNPKFRKVFSPAYAYADESYGSYASYAGYGSADIYKTKPLYGKTKVDCGFKPGRVISYQKAAKTCAAGDCY